MSAGVQKPYIFNTIFVSSFWHFGIPTFRKDRSSDQEAGDWSFLFQIYFIVYNNKFRPPRAVIRLQLTNGSKSQIKVKVIQWDKDSQLIPSPAQPTLPLPTPLPPLAAPAPLPAWPSSCHCLPPVSWLEDCSSRRPVVATSLTRGACWKSDLLLRTTSACDPPILTISWTCLSRQVEWEDTPSILKLASSPPCMVKHIKGDAAKKSPH